jgi:CBS domain-containing protein
MHDAVAVMSEKRMGLVGVDDDGNLIGVITDGDLRRNIERGLDHIAAEFMTKDPKTITRDSIVAAALALFEDFRHGSVRRRLDGECIAPGRDPAHSRLRGRSVNVAALIPARFASSTALSARPFRSAELAARSVRP